MIFCYKEFRDNRMAIMDQEELAQKSGVSVNVIKNMDSGRKRNVKIDNPDFLSLCSTLGFDPNDYFIRDTKVIAVFTNKGGAGKTTICANLSHILATNYNMRILLIDADQQCNLTTHFNMNEITYADRYNLYEAFVRQESIKEYIHPTGYKNLDIVISNLNVGMIDPMLPTLSYREKRMANIINPIKELGYYDYIFIDCNPSFSMLNNVILCASDSALIPLEPTAFGLGGIENVVEFINANKEGSLSAGDNGVDILGIVISKFDKRIKLNSVISKVSEELFEKEGYLFKSKIPMDSSIGKCQTEKKPIGINYQKSNAYIALNALAKEVISRGI